MTMQLDDEFEQTEQHRNLLLTHRAIFSNKQLAEQKSRADEFKLKAHLEYIHKQQDILTGLEAVKAYALLHNLPCCRVQIDFFAQASLHEHPKNCWFFQKKLKANRQDWEQGYIEIPIETINHNIQLWQERIFKAGKVVE